MDPTWLAVIATLLTSELAVQLCTLVLLVWRIRREHLERELRTTPWIDVPARDLSGKLPCGGRYEVVAGLREGEPFLPSGVLVLDVRSEVFWVFEVWARTDHGWVQLQPGPGEGAFRNSLVAGVRLNTLRLWLASAGRQPEEADLRDAAGLLVPAALLLTRVRPTGTPQPAPPREALGPLPTRSIEVPHEAHTPVD